MKVKAISMGFAAGGRRRPGEVFEVPMGSKATWYTPVDEPVGAEKPAPRRKSGTLTLAEGGRQVGADLGNADLA